MRIRRKKEQTETSKEGRRREKDNAPIIIKKVVVAPVRARYDSSSKPRRPFERGRDEADDGTANLSHVAQRGTERLRLSTPTTPAKKCTTKVEMKSGWDAIPVGVAKSGISANSEPKGPRVASPA